MTPNNTDQSAEASSKAALDSPSGAYESKSDAHFSPAQFAGDLLRSAAYTAIASPLEGALQLADQAKQTHFQANSHDFFANLGVTAPQSDATGAKWLAQTIGQVGNAVPMLLLRKSLGGVLANKGATIAGERAAIGFTLRESAATGFIQGSLLTPTDDKDGFIPGRIDKGLGTSAQFIGMTATGLGVGRFAESGLGVKYGLNRALSNQIVSGVVSGIPSGLVSAQMDAFSQGRVLPTGAEVGQSMLSMSLLGGIFGVQHLATENLAFKRSLNPQSHELLSHPDVKALLRSPRPELKGPDYLLKQPGVDVSLPTPTGPFHKVNNSLQAPWKFGDMTTGADHNITVQDNVYGVSRQYVGERLISAQARPQDASHTYAYNSDNDLRAIVTGPNQGWFKARDGWAPGRIDPDSGRLTLYPAQASAAMLTADGVMLSKGTTAWSLPLTARFFSADADGAALTHRDLARERNLTDYLARRSASTPEAAGSPPRVQYFTEDGTALTLHSQLEAFRTAAQKHGLKTGYGQLEAEVGRSVAAGNEAEALSLLVAAQKLLPLEGVTSLMTSRTANGALNIAAEGYTDGKHLRYLLDGTAISTGQMIRTTKYPDGSKLEETFLDGYEKTKYNSSGNIEQTIVKTRAGDIVKDITYTPDAKISSADITLNDHKVSLIQTDGQWRAVLDSGAQVDTASNTKLFLDPKSMNRQMSVDLGPGTLEIQPGGEIFFKGQDDSASTYFMETDGRVILNDRKRRMDITPGQPVRVSEADLTKESNRQSELTQTILKSASEREQFTAAVQQFDLEAQRVNFQPATKAVLLAEVNNVLQRNPTQAAGLLQAITELADALPNRSGHDTVSDQAMAVDKTPYSTSISIANRVIDIDSKGNFALRQSPLLRFDGVTDSQFRTAVTEAAAHDISPSIAKLLRINDIAVVGTPTVPDAFPQLSQLKPVGWPGGSSSNALGALYDSEGKRIAVAQRHQVYQINEDPMIRTKNPSLEMLRAVGFAVDDILKISNSEPFKKAFEADEKSLKEPGAVAFYQGDDQQANFSNLFADLFTGTQVKNPQATLLRKKFPQTAALVDKSVSAIKGREESLKANRPDVSSVSEAVASAPIDHIAIPNTALNKQPVIEEQLANAVGHIPVYPDFMQSQLAYQKVDTIKAEVDSLLAGETQPAAHQTLLKNSDGTMQLIDSIAQSRRTYDSSGNMIKAEHFPAEADPISSQNANLTQYYLYDQNRKLKAVFENDQSGYIHTPEGWLRVTLDKQLKLRPADTIVSMGVHPEGGLLLGRQSYWTSQMVNGRKGLSDDSSFKLDNASLTHEKNTFENAINTLDESQRADLHAILDQFLQLSTKQKMSENQQGKLLAAISDSLADNPAKAQALFAAVTNQMRLTPPSLFSYERGVDGSITVELITDDIDTQFFNDGGSRKVVQTSYGKDTTILDEHGQILSQNFEPNPATVRSVESNENGLIKVQDNLNSGDTYTVSLEGNDYVRVVKNVDGTEQRFNLGPGKLAIARTNDIIFTPTDPSQPQLVHNSFYDDTLRHSDGRVERLRFNGRMDFIAADLATESHLLKQNIRASIGGDKAYAPLRIQRFEKLLDQYKESLPNNEAAGVRGTKALVLAQLNRLLADDPRAAFSRSERVDLAEQLLAHTIDPLKIWQGSHQTCNVATVEHRLMVQAPDRVIGLVADLTMKGSYTRTDGRQFSLDSLVGVHSPDSEALSNLKRQTNPNNAVTSDHGDRDWASQIAQTALLRAAWMDKEVYLVGNQILPNYTVALVKNPENGKLTPVKIDPASIKPLDVRDGNAPVIDLVYNTVIGNVRNSDYTPLHDKEGRRLEKLKPGDTGYDAYGRPLVRRAGEHEIGFGKNFLNEDVLVSLLDSQETPLIDPAHNLMDSPQMDLDDIANAYTAVFHDSYKPANIIAFNKSSVNITNVDSEEALINLAQSQEKSSELPAILMVHTRSPIFGAWDKGGFHVVNLYAPTLDGKTLRYSNQWGAQKDAMGSGADTNLLFASMRRPPDLPDMPQIVVPLPRVAASSD